MELVVASFVAAVVIALVVWLLIVSRAVEADSAKDRAAKQEQAVIDRALDRDRRMRLSGSPIRCLGCNTTFNGPLTDAGCPNCHSAAFVIPEDEYVQRISGSQR